MDPSIIPAVSMDMSLSNTARTFDTSLLRQTLDTQEANSDYMIQNLLSLSPNLGRQLDVSA